MASMHGVVYEIGKVHNQRRLVLLHGAGVPGELTWTFIANYLNQWNEILIIDFPNMGSSKWRSQKVFPRLSDYSQLICQLLAALDWDDIDIAGYSFGGLVAASLVDNDLLKTNGQSEVLCTYAGKINHLFLLEPAMLFSETASDLELRGAEYMALAKKIMAKPDDDDAYLYFLDAVSPLRKQSIDADRLTIDRLKSFSTGFAQAIYAVSRELSDRSQYLANWVSPINGASFLGELGVDSMHKRHKRLLNDTLEHGALWSVNTIRNADHSLVFTRPRLIAKAMNDFYSQH